IDRKAMVGDYLAGSYIQSLENPANRRFLKLLQTTYNQAPVATDTMEGGYVAVHLWAKAVQAAGSTDTKAVRQALHGQKFDGPGGTVKMVTDGLYATKYARLGMIQPDKNIGVVWSSPAPLQPEPFPATRTRAEWEAFLQEQYLNWGKQWANPGPK